MLRQKSSGTWLAPIPPGSSVGCAQVVSHMVLATHSWEQPRWSSTLLDTDWNRRFSGGTSNVPGALGAVSGSKRLDPDGWLVRIPAPEAQRDYGRAPGRSTRRAEPGRSEERTLPVGRGVGR